MDRKHEAETDEMMIAGRLLRPRAACRVRGLVVACIFIFVLCTIGNIADEFALMG